MKAETPSIALFETAIGPCGIAWGDRGVRATALPHRRRELTRAHLRRRLPGAREAEAPAAVEEAISGLVALLDGARSELTEVVLDLDEIDPFDRRVTEAARTIGPGETLTYGELARRIGAPGEAREVGKALSRNRFPLIVPCHRVVAADGRLGGFSAPGGAETKRRLLAIERPHAGGEATLFDAGGCSASG